MSRIATVFRVSNKWTGRSKGIAGEFGVDCSGCLLIPDGISILVFGRKAYSGLKWRIKMSRRERLPRRNVLTAGICAAGAAAAAGRFECGRAGSTSEPRVRMAELLPHEFRTRLRARPVAYLPLGTIEWHGEHLPLGSDAIQSEELMVECARQLGGIVMPALYVGPDRAKLQPDGSYLIGMDYAPSTQPPRQLEGSCYWVSQGVFSALLDAILLQIRRAGFQAVFADGHGPSRTSWSAGIEDRQRRFGLKLLGVTPELKGRWRSQTDHAARNETSQMLHYRPDLVDLSQLPADRAVWPQGVGGKDPRDATAAFGRECIAASIEIVRRELEAAGV